MSYEDQLIREATGEHQERPFNPFGDETLEAEDRDVTNETGDDVIRKGKFCTICGGPVLNSARVLTCQPCRHKQHLAGQKLKVKTDIVRRYYVQQGDWIYAGPFDTREEARQALADASNLNSQQSTTAQP